MEQIGGLDGLLRRAVKGRLARIEGDGLRLREGGAEEVLGCATPAPDRLLATVEVVDPRGWSDIALRGVLGAGEAYVHGRWTTDDLTTVARILLRNRHVMTDMDGGVAKLSRPLLRLYHRLRANTREGSRKNIAAHYDLGNELFALFLDDSMTYSCGLFEHEHATLEEAQAAKYERLCRKLRLERRHHVLEIGCGWGGFALHAARHHGCRVTATTISEAQFEHARGAVRRAGLEDRIHVVRQDYRDLDGTFDRVVSIEMIEAVGHEHLDRYLAVIRDRLQDDGMAAVQAIVLADEHYDRARKTVDFIKRHVFPGSFIPSVAAITASLARTGGMKLAHLEDIGPHYARTLALWRERFLARADEVRDLGFPDSFLRAWTYYFSYCEAGFLERDLGLVQLVFARPKNRAAPLLGTLTPGAARGARGSSVRSTRRSGPSSSAPGVGARVRPSRL